MNINKCTLIIDGNWLLMSRASTLMKDFSKAYDEKSLENSKHNLVELLAQSINKIIGFFSSEIDNIILVQDGGSWRKKLSLPKLYTTDTYKGTRILTDDIAWDYIWDAGELLARKFDEFNITCCKQTEIEGDDWCWFWSTYLNNQNINAVIWSTDNDLKQLVRYHPVNNSWTIWYNSINGVFVPKNTLSEVDMFFEINNNATLLESILKKCTKKTIIDGQDVIMLKTICGDAGDNIKPLVRVENNNRALKVSEKEWLAVKSELNIQDLDDFKRNKICIIQKIKDIKRLSKNTDKIEDLIEMFDFNMRVVMLEESVYPDYVLEKMTAEKDSYKIIEDMSFIKNNYKILSTVKPLENASEIFDDLPF